MIAQLLLIAGAFLAGAGIAEVGTRRWRQLMAGALCCFILSRLFVS